MQFKVGGRPNAGQLADRDKLQHKHQLLPIRADAHHNDLSKLQRQSRIKRTELYRLFCNCLHKVSGGRDSG